MRVSDSHLYDINVQSLEDARSRTSRLQMEALEQRRVFTPSDDPVAAAAGRREAGRLERTEQHERTVNAGIAALQLADSALAQVGDALVRLRELALQHASDSIGSSQRDIGATEVAELRSALRDLANAEHAGQYVFAGYRDDAPPFDATGAYNGDSNARELEVAPGVRLTAGLAGDAVFQGAGGGTDVFAVTEAFETALRNNDVAGVRSALTDMDAAQEQINDARAALGGQQSAFDIAHAVLERTRIDANQRIEDLVAVDTAESYLELTRAQETLTTAVQIAAQLPLPGLTSG